MSAWHPFADGIQLHVPGRICTDDARRQETTAREILCRLKEQPGLILADGVGMGKTFVALAVAASVSLSDPARRPVVVLVPSGLKQKWPQDFEVFKERCLPERIRQEMHAASADTAVEFLRMLYARSSTRSSIIFLTHGAMHRGLSDGWIKLAIIWRSLRGRHNVTPLRRALTRCLGPLLQLGWAEKRHPDIWEMLLRQPPSSWLRVMHRHDIGPHGKAAPESDNDPVPEAVINVLDDLDTNGIYDVLQTIPRRDSANWADRITTARRVLAALLQEVWRDCMLKLRINLPLLVMDEAHHLKNDKTRLAGLFQASDAQHDADEISRGALGEVFERMLFLTATPFQLGHHELCSVLERFNGIAWASPAAPSPTRDRFKGHLMELLQKLDRAQLAALDLDATWGKLRPDDLISDTNPSGDVESWWASLKSGGHRSEAAEQVLASYQRTLKSMRAAEQDLRPWVIRHQKLCEFGGRARRERMVGAAIELDQPATNEAGLAVSGPALLPFLLAARATVCDLDSRPVFAEGLASSFEAFRDTRKSTAQAIDDDDDLIEQTSVGDRTASWYLQQLESALPTNEHDSWTYHPKVAATARRVSSAWGQGEKVLVFCHYIATGRVLRQVISGLMKAEIARLGAAKIGCEPSEAVIQLQRIGKRFFDNSSQVRRTCDAEITGLLEKYPQLVQHSDTILDVTRRYLRTPSFLVRYFPLVEKGLNAASVEEAFAANDGSGLCLRDVLRDFFEFLANRCADSERECYLTAIERVQTGTITGGDATEVFAADELQGAASERLLPNVRLVNGSTAQQTRQRIMLTFNSPFFPEVLVASSVMSEGVDLHRFCRYVIHHDLCWNPSTLEQRTGRVDRIGAKVERCGHPIQVFLPYLAETQDEKMFRVVMDRERWFCVVMGEQLKSDVRTTDKLAQRVPLPNSLAQELAFRLEVVLPGDPSAGARRADDYEVN